MSNYPIICRYIGTHDIFRIYNKFHEKEDGYKKPHSSPRDKLPKCTFVIKHMDMLVLEKYTSCREYTEYVCHPSLPLGKEIIFLFISTGNSHTAGITKQGDLYAWGMNDRCQLGTGDLIDRKDPCRIELLSEEGRVIELECRLLHTIVITSTMNGYGMGLNLYNQLGNGCIQSLSPTKIKGRWKQILETGCSTFLKSANGLHYGCGWNSNGELMMGHNTMMTIPYPIIFSTRFGKIVSIASGDSETLILNRDGKVYHNYGSYEMISKENERVESILCGLDWKMMITRDGKLYAWGSRYMSDDIRRITLDNKDTKFVYLKPRNFVWNYRFIVTLKTILPISRLLSIGFLCKLPMEIRLEILKFLDEDKVFNSKHWRTLIDFSYHRKYYKLKEFIQCMEEI